MQSWNLETKIQVTQTRILEWYKHYDGNVYVSFSGGKDSTVLLDLVRRMFPDVEAVYCDTGLEYPEIREFVKTLDNITWIKPKKNFKQIIKEYGYPIISKEQALYIYEYRNTRSDKLRDKRWNGDEKGRFKISEKWKFLVDAPFKISNNCCYTMKKSPFKCFERATKKKPFIGTLTEESSIRKNAWIKYGCNTFKTKRPSSQPLSFWTEQDILEYISRFKIPYASVYGEIKQDENGKYYTTGVERTGCVFCAFGVHLEKEPNRFQKLKETHPKLWNYCMKSWAEGGLGMKEILDYIGVKYD